MEHIEYWIFYKSEMIKHTISELMYLKVYFIYLYINLFKGKFILYYLLPLIILWTHLIAWLMYDITITAVNYFNKKHSFYFFSKLKYVEFINFIKFFYFRKKINLYKSTLCFLA